MAGTTLRIVDADDGGMGWVVRAGRGQAPLTVPANRESAIRSATLDVLGRGGGTVQIYARTGSLLEERSVGAGPPETFKRPAPPARPPQTAQPAAPTPSPAAANTAPGDEAEEKEKYPAKLVFGVAALFALWAWFGRPQEAIAQLLSDRGVSDETKDEMLFVAWYALPATVASCLAFLYLTRDKESSGTAKTFVVLGLFLAAGLACRVFGLGYPVEFTLDTGVHGNAMVTAIGFVGMAYLNAYGVVTLLAATSLGTWAAMTAENKWGKLIG